MRRRNALIALVAAAASFPVRTQTIRGSGVAKSEQRSLAPFDRIEVSGDFDVTLVDGPEHRITVEADDNLLDAVSADVIDAQLRIASLRSFVSRTPMKLTVESPQQRGLTIAGSANVTAASLRGPDFALAGSGSSTARLGGRVEHLKISLVGSGRIDALDLVADRVDIEIAGSGTAEVHAVKALDLMVIGAGTVRYRGDPKISRYAIGRGRVERVN